ncbi:MAG: hypothetical protein ABIP89_11770 [Polyangiaceae bacterium]
MKRCLAFIAAIGLVACATSTAPPDDGVVYGAGVEAGDDGNPYGGGDDSGSLTDSGETADSGAAQDASTTTDTGTVADTGASDTGGGPPPGVCAKTSIQQVEYAAAVLGGGTSCPSPSDCAAGECCYPNSILPLCVGE